MNNRSPPPSPQCKSKLKTCINDQHLTLQHLLYSSHLSLQRITPPITTPTPTLIKIQSNIQKNFTGSLSPATAGLHRQQAQNKPWFCFTQSFRRQRRRRRSGRRRRRKRTRRRRRRSHPGALTAVCPSSVCCRAGTSAFPPLTLRNPLLKLEHMLTNLALRNCGDRAVVNFLTFLNKF